MITVYGKPDCGLCKSAKQKLMLMGLEFESKDLESSLAVHDGWREDGTVEALAAHTLKGMPVPFLKIDEDFYTYPQAMRLLKKERKR